MVPHPVAGYAMPAGINFVVCNAMSSEIIRINLKLNNNRR